MTGFVLLALARWLHFGAVMVLFGSSLFRVYCLMPAISTTLLLRIATLIAITSAFVWVSVSITSVTGDLASLYDPATVASYFIDTQFGRVWLVCLLILISIVALVFAPGRTLTKSSAHFATLAATSGSLLISQAWLGHAAAASASGPWPPIIAYGIHVLAAGAWLGGLPALAELTGVQVATAALEATLRRFSTLGMLSVAALLVSGLANVLFRISSLTEAAKTAYGQTIVIKITLLVLLLGLAAQNRLYVMPLLRKEQHMSRSLAILKRNVVVEQVFGAGILLAAAVLGLLPPQG